MKEVQLFDHIDAEPGSDEARPSVMKASAHFQEVLCVFDNREDADVGRLGVVLASR